MEIEFIKSSVNSDDIIISLKSPKSGELKNNNIVISYDKSYSMTECSNPNGSELMKTYSKHDLSLHMVEIIIKSLSDNDTIEVIVYDSTVKKTCGRTKMTSEGKEKVLNIVKNITPGGGTALYDGMVEALESAKYTNEEYNDCAVLMMTDGEPSVSPSNGEIEALKSYRINKKNNCRIYTIGVGYAIKSKLLYEISSIDNDGSCFIFIPDGSMMITTAVNILGYEKSLFAKDIKIGNNKCGIIAYGQTKNIIMTHNDLSNIKSISYYSFKEKKNVEIDITYLKYTYSVNSYMIIKSLKTIEDSLNDIQKIAHYDINKSAELLKKLIEKEYEVMKDHPIMEDLMGEVSSSLENKEVYNKWGNHYIRSLLSAYKNNRCFNFKDPGPKTYDSEFIVKEKDKIDIVAKTVDPPIQSLLYNTNYGANTQVVSVPVTRTIFDNVFNNVYGGCFGENGIVSLENGRWKYVKDIVKGDKLHNGAKVECVVKFMNCTTLEMKSLNNLVITPWHPIYICNVWKFPIDYEPTGIRRLESVVYTYILDKEHMININGVDACTLGHNFKGPVIQHAFYGTEVVVNDLKKFQSYNEGIVELTERNIMYDLRGEVIGYIM